LYMQTSTCAPLNAKADFAAPAAGEHEEVPVKNDRLANTVLYMLRACPDAGLTKLLKLLYFADYEHYREHLTTITGATYVALARGPVLDNYEEHFGSLESRGIMASREPNMEAFSDAELETLSAVVLKYGGLTGRALSNMTHEEALPWSYAWDPEAPGNVIPPSLFRWLENMPNEQDVATARARTQAAFTRPDPGAPPPES